VVFLDPYGMQVEWSTIEVLGNTKGVDLWYLFPLGIGVLRLLSHNGQIDKAWQRRLDTTLGTPDWRSRFYKIEVTEKLFGDVEELKRDATAESIQKFIQDRLLTCFAKVADGLILRNSRSFPMYSLCFAASNERGAQIAVKIAQHILKERPASISGSGG
jgi:three-Cys-motif partner protein